jgi:hypothetical protein
MHQLYWQPMLLNALVSLSLFLFTTSVSSQLLSSRTRLQEHLTRPYNTLVQAFHIHKDAKTAFTTFVSEEYIQHSPSALSGRQTALHFLSPILPSLNITILH